MTPKIALSLGAAVLAIVGMLRIFVPDVMLSGVGLAATREGLVLSRDDGALLLGLAVINWLARGASASALQGVLVGNLSVQLLQFAVDGYELLTGQLPQEAEGGEVVHILLGLIFFWALRRPRPA